MTRKSVLLVTQVKTIGLCMAGISPEMSPLKKPAVPTGLEPKRTGCFRITSVGSMIFLELGAALAAASVITMSLATMGIVPIAVAVGTGAACISLGVVAIWRKIVPVLPEYLRPTAQLLQSIADSILAAVTLGLMFPINLEAMDRKERGSINDTPVLFIHGFLGSSNNWLYYKRRLQEVGHENLFTINLGNPTLSIKDYALKVHDKVKEIQRITGRDDIILVGHSMGGLVAREFMYHHPVESVHVRKIITLGTPLAGTRMARLASWVSKCAKEMLPNSDMVKELHTAAQKDSLTRYQHIGSKVDCIILPRQSAVEQVRTLTQNVELEATGHIGYLFSDTAADIVVREIQETKNPLR